MRICLILLFILSSFGWANAQSFERQPWAYKDQKVASSISNDDFYSGITLDYNDEKIWLVWEFEGPIAIKSYLGAATNGAQETMLNVHTWGKCHHLLGCIIKKQGNRTWISFSLTNQQLDAIAKDETINFSYTLENDKRKGWEQNLTGSRDAIIQFRQAHSIQQAAYFSEDIRVEYLGNAVCDVKRSLDFEGKNIITECRQDVTLTVPKSTGYSKAALDCFFAWRGYPKNDSSNSIFLKLLEKPLVDIAADGTGSKTIKLVLPLSGRIGLYTGTYIAGFGQGHEVCTYNEKLSTLR